MLLFYVPPGISTTEMVEVEQKSITTAANGEKSNGQMETVGSESQLELPATTLKMECTPIEAMSKELGNILQYLLNMKLHYRSSKSYRRIPRASC